MSVSSALKMHAQKGLAQGKLSHGKAACAKYAFKCGDSIYFCLNTVPELASLPFKENAVSLT